MRKSPCRNFAAQQINAITGKTANNRIQVIFDSAASPREIPAIKALGQSFRINHLWKANAADAPNAAATASVDTSAALPTISGEKHHNRRASNPADSPYRSLAQTKQM